MFNCVFKKIGCRLLNCDGCHKGKVTCISNECSTYFNFILQQHIRCYLRGCEVQYKKYERYKSLAYFCKDLHPIVVCSSPCVCNLSPICCPRGFVVDASLHFYVFQIIAYPSHVGIFCNKQALSVYCRIVLEYVSLFIYGKKEAKKKHCLAVSGTRKRILFIVFIHVQIVQVD